jgi:hypothetical protein
MSSEPRPRSTAPRWVKSSYSGPTGGNCIEVAALGDRRIGLRDSWIPAGQTLEFTAGQWHDFLSGAKDGKFA